jgi:hypothetical protein
MVFYKIVFSEPINITHLLSLEDRSEISRAASKSKEIKIGFESENSGHLVDFSTKVKFKALALTEPIIALDTANQIISAFGDFGKFIRFLVEQKDAVNLNHIVFLQCNDDETWKEKIITLQIEEIKN